MHILSKYILYLALPAMLTCNQGYGNFVGKVRPGQTRQLTEGKSDLRPVARGSKTGKKEIITFICENDTIVQRLEFKYLSKTKIDFWLTSINKRLRDTSSITGLAKWDSTQDPEMDDDEDGNSYAANQFVFEKDCWLGIRIDDEKGERIRIVEGDCEARHHASSPFESVGVLRKVKVKNGKH